MGKNITKGCPQSSSINPLLWSIQYDAVLNLQLFHHTRAVAFVDDLLLMIRADSIREAEIIANVEIYKIATWAENNKTKFNEEKSKLMLMTRRKRKEQKEVAVNMKNKITLQVQKLKYSGIIFDYQINF